MASTFTVPVERKIFEAIHAGSNLPDAPKRSGSPTHHKRRVPRQQLMHQLALVLANWEIGANHNDTAAKHAAKDLVLGLSRLGVL